MSRKTFKTREDPSTRIRIFFKSRDFFLHISLSSSLVPRRSLLTLFSARSVTSQFTVESMIDLAENVRGYAAFRLFVYTHILVLRASWGPEHEDQEALPGGTEDLESWTFRTSGRSLLPVISDLSTTFLIAFTCSCRIVNDCKFR